MTTFAERPSGDTADGELVRAYLDGDDAAFEQLYDRHHRYVVGTLARRVDDYALAQDLAQETWVRFVQYSGTYDTARAFRPWLRKIAVNLVPAEMSRLYSQVPLEGTRRAEPSLPDPADAIVELDRVLRCLRKLPKRQREALRLRYLEDQDSNTIAELLGMKRNAVEQLLLRARTSLRECMGSRDAAVPALAAFLTARFRRVVEAVVARFHVASGATMSVAGDFALGAALTLGGFGLVQAAMPSPAAATDVSAVPGTQDPASEPFSDGRRDSRAAATTAGRAVTAANRAADPRPAAAAAPDDVPYGTLPVSDAETGAVPGPAPETHPATASPAPQWAPLPITDDGAVPAPADEQPPAEDEPAAGVYAEAPGGGGVSIETSADPGDGSDGDASTTGKVELGNPIIESVEVSFVDAPVCFKTTCLTD